MQPNKTKIALLIGASYLGAFSASNALADTFQMKVNTITDVTIEPKAGGTTLSFGEQIKTSTGACAMEGRYPENADVGVEHSTLPSGPDLAKQGVITGPSCVGSGSSTGDVGMYVVKGSPGLTVNFRVSEVTQVNPIDAAKTFTFKPNSGCYTVFDGTQGSDADSCTPYTMGNTITSVKLPVSDAAESENPGGAVIPGEIYFTIGGTLEIGPNGLDQNQSYDAKFLVDVTY
jgi:hypothetical protein